MSIKDLPIRAYKTGKTRGRPSKEELNASRILSWYWTSKRMNIDTKGIKCYKLVCENDKEINNG